MAEHAEITVLAERLVQIDAPYWLVCLAADSFGYSVGPVLDVMRRLRAVARERSGAVEPPEEAAP